MNQSQSQLVLKAFVKDKVAMFGLAIILFFTLIAIFAELIAPYDPNSVLASAERLSPIGTEGHLLGTDQQGRDIFSRIVLGTRPSLIAAIFPVLISAIISIMIGITAGYFQGVIGNVLMRIMDVFFAFPAVLLAIAITAILGPGLVNVMIALIVVRIPYMTRVVYTDTIQESQKEYVEAAKALGANRFEIMFKQILPNVLPSLLVYATTLAGVTIVTVAGLSFIGLGVQPPDPDWGRMASEGSVVLMQGYPHVTFLPGIAILIISLAFSLLGDGLRDALDPHQQTKVKRSVKELEQKVS